MTIRTRETTVTFRHRFLLSAIDERLPAGTYRVVIDEEELSDISFLAYRRSATMLHTPDVATRGGGAQVFTVDPEELEKALEADVLM